MDIFLKKYTIYLSVMLIFFMLMGLVFFGIKNGQEKARSLVTLGTVQNIQSALEYFYKDQDRFPGNQDFFSSEIFHQYIDLKILKIISSEKRAFF